jgi:hypothetical protein
MSRNTLIGRLLTPAGFATALALFLLPFLTFSCAGPATPSEEGSTDVGLSAKFTAVDLILDGDPTIELRQDGVVTTIDSSGLPADPAGPAEEEEPVPTKIRAPMIGSAAALFVGVLLALIPATTVRRLLVALAALVAAAASTYVIYFAAPDYLEKSRAELATLGAPPDVALESAPATGFWAIVGVLAVVLLLQLIPTPPATPVPAPPMPPPGPYGAPPG